MRQISVRERLPNDAAWVVALVMAVYTALDLAGGGFGYDSHAYWLAVRDLDYSRPPGAPDAFNYSPAFAQVLSPLSGLPFPLFASLFSLAAAAGFWWLLSPLPPRWRIPFFIACSYEIESGNVFWALAIGAVIGLRHPAAWTFAALTKLTPCLGPVWFLARGEWRRLAIFAVSLLVVVGISATIDPTGWSVWLSFLAHHSSGGYTGALPIPLAIRAAAAVVIVAVGARTDRVGLLPVGMVIATPVFAHGALTMLCAFARLRDQQNADQSEEVSDHDAA